ncbi:MAG: ImmA/IrrE family metallo-endopeptidase [Amaricoccus sp.]|uniref:ImmA/IrrE family metallo-endopeptidase n=1 Tax=Amaricoccus sp. TaxID=1872485 RepID=UPI003314B5A4
MTPERAAIALTKILDARDGVDRFDRAPVDPEWLALNYSAQVFSNEPIVVVKGEALDGCVGALVFGETKPRRWGILYDERQDPRRRNFTVAHELGHYLLHREMIEETTPDGLYCSEADVEQGRGSTAIEKEADLFAATLLMPLHDFRKQLTPKARADFTVLGRLGDRYGVSLTAVILRWLDYTETRAMVVVSNEGFALWAKSSSAAFRSGRFIRTKNTLFELPEVSIAKSRLASTPGIMQVSQPGGAWFDEPVFETSLRANRLDQEITLLQFDASYDEMPEEPVSDLVDRMAEPPWRTR